MKAPSRAEDSVTCRYASNVQHHKNRTEPSYTQLRGEFRDLWTTKDDTCASTMMGYPNGSTLIFRSAGRLEADPFAAQPLCRTSMIIQSSRWPAAALMTIKSDRGECSFS